MQRALTARLRTSASEQCLVSLHLEQGYLMSASAMWARAADVGFARVNHDGRVEIDLGLVSAAVLRPWPRRLPACLPPFASLCCRCCYSASAAIT